MKYGAGTLTISILIMLGIAVLPDATHFCRATETAKRCDRLSYTKYTCYPTPGTRLGSKYCSNQWEEISHEPPPVVKTNLTYLAGYDIYSCGVNGCTPI